MSRLVTDRSLELMAGIQYSSSETAAIRMPPRLQIGHEGSRAGVQLRLQAGCRDWSRIGHSNSWLVYSIPAVKPRQYVCRRGFRSDMREAGPGCSFGCRLDVATGHGSVTRTHGWYTVFQQ